MGMVMAIGEMTFGRLLIEIVEYAIVALGLFVVVVSIDKRMKPCWIEWIAIIAMVIVLGIWFL